MAFTFFFRDSHTIEQAIKNLLPRIQGFQKIKVWDAGCAMGPEPFTFAIILAENMGYFAFKSVEIDATDIDETDSFGKVVNDGTYPLSDLSRIPEEIFKKYFKPATKDGYYIIDENIKNRVRFYKNDLLKLSPVGMNYNIIMCKNVLLHLQYEERVEVIKMFHDSLTGNGLLVTEQTQQMPDECSHLFNKITTDACVYEVINK